ncbi:MAG: hypothetical protein ACUVX8_04290 [Candidatus Zipacnadales bacterium]
MPATVVFAERLWILGGVASSGECLSDVWSSPDGVHWELVTANAPWGPRAAAACSVHDGRMWLMGGMHLPDFAHYHDVWCSTDGTRWDCVIETAPWAERAMHASVAYKGRIWVLGGGVYNTNYAHNTVVDYNDVWSSVDGRNWRQVTPSAAWPARRFHSSAIYNGKMWVIAGYARGNLNDMWFSTDGVAWQQAQTRSIWPIRHEPSCLVFDNRLWIIGGYGDRLYNDVWMCCTLLPGE